MNLRKIQIQGDNKSKHFKKLAKSIVMDEVGGTTDENKEVIAMFTARDMAIGSVVTKNKYLLTGGVIGVLGTALTIGIYNKFKKRRNTDEKVEVGE